MKKNINPIQLKITLLIYTYINYIKLIIDQLQ